jgi:hypothetical protein
MLASIRDEAKVTRALVLKYAGFVVHELLHRKYTNFACNSKIDYVRVLHNAIEDAWIENSAIAASLTGNIQPLLAELVDSMTREALTEVTNWNDSNQYPYILAVYLRKHTTLKCPCNPRLKPIFDEAAKRLNNVASSEDTLAIAEWVYKSLNLAAQQDRTNPPPKGKPKSSDGDAPASPQDGPTSPDQGGGGGSGGQDGDEAPSGPINTPSKHPREVEPTLSGGDDSTKGSFSTGSIKETPRTSIRSSWTDRPAVSAKLKYEVKRLFENSGYSEFNHNRKAGVIDSHKLQTVQAGNDRVFKRRTDVAGVDSAVVICIDVSQSMYPHQLIRYAVAACRALLETLSAAGVETAVLAFGCSVSVVKPFRKNHKAVDGVLSSLSDDGSTNDYLAVRYAHEMLYKHSAERKIVFVLTDGDGNPKGVRQQVQSGNALGITTVGIGIQHDVARVYGQAIRIDDLSDIGNSSFRQIKLAA